MPASATGPAVVTVTAVLDRPDGSQVPVALARTDFDRDDLTAGQALPLDASGGVYRTTAGFVFLEPDSHTGVSLHELVSTGVGVAVANVRTVDIQGPTASGRLSTVSADLDAPADDHFPFEYNAQPAFIYDGDNLYFAVGARTVVPVDPPVMNGVYIVATPGESIHLVLHLSSTLQALRVQADPAAVRVGQTVQFHGRVDSADPTQPLMWSWRVGQQEPFGDGPDPTTTFSRAGHYEVVATVTAPDGSTGTTSTFVDVTGSTSTPPPTSPPPTQRDRGTGGPAAPDVGPRQGSGPVVGGVPTARDGTGAPGRTAAPDRSGSVATATASAGSTRAAGAVMGYVLSNATAAVVDVPPGARPRDDSARAARAGTEAVSLPDWVIAAAAAVLLASLGALSERRRPTTARTRPRRKR
ncbi:PKD domain-containing protein [Jatrophihabitans sp. YIM 134969]